MSALFLKIIACLTMLSDHIGYTLGIEYPYRYIGRIAFPIYAFLLTEGYTYTKNLKKYISRLFLFSVISEIPYNLFTENSIISPGSSLNIFYTLLLALFTLYSLDFIQKQQTDKILNILTSSITIAVFCLIAEVLNTDYGYYGILTVLCFRYFKNAKRRNLSLLTTHFIIILLYAVSNKMTEWSIIQFVALLSLIPILLYNGKKGFSPENPLLSKTMQIGFYMFYPLHLLVLYLIYL